MSAKVKESSLSNKLDIMKINILDSVLCVILVFLLVPKIAVDGYINDSLRDPGNR